MRSEIASRIRWKAFAAATFAVAIMLAAPPNAYAQQVVAFVNGQPITTLDIEHRAKFLQMSSKKVPPRKEVLDSLIDEILEIAEAKRYGLDVPDAQVDESYNTVASRMGIDAQKLTQLLAAGGASDDTLKRRLRAQIAWTNLVRGRYKASLEIRDKDVEAQLQLHKTEDKIETGYEYIMRPVVFIVPRGSPDAAYEARKRDAEALRSRFANCNEGITLARSPPCRGARPGLEIFRRPRSAAPANPRRHRDRPPDAAGADGGGGADVRGLRQEGNKIRDTGDEGNPRSDVSTEIRRPG